jgi:NAD-dependent SIR2 family protein deacetylase
MRSCILLYDDKSCDDDAIGTVIQQDLAKVKVFLCAGTSLAVPGMKKLADDMCSRATISIWISREEPPAGTHWDVKYVGDCDDLAQFYFRDCSDVSI